jgi:probable HAF family extracellular repeat protein
MIKEHIAVFRRRPTLLIILSLAVFTAVGVLVWRLHKPPALYRITILPAHLLAERLNDQGQVVGLVYENGGTRPFLWDRTHGIQDLGFVGGCPRGLWINNAGQIAGTMPTDPNCSEAFLWEPGKGVTMLGTLGGRRSYVNAMNNRGQIAGMSYAADGSPRPFLWDKETGMEELPSCRYSIQP